jgi:hypothetical protein
MKDLNRLSAEKIMGYEVRESIFFSGILVRERPDQEWWLFNPLLDANTCFQVIKKLEQLGYWVFWNNEENKVEFFNKSGDICGTDINPNPHVAILTAALKAIKALEE